MMVRDRIMYEGFEIMSSIASRGRVQSRYPSIEEETKEYEVRLDSDNNKTVWSRDISSRNVWEHTMSASQPKLTNNQ